jgi:UPF0716 family protein affecting phage T7 exclusion
VNPDKVQPGLLGLGFVVLLALAVVVLWFSLRRHLGRIDVGRHERERRAGSEPQKPSES